jgi:hypothetical protein
MLKIPFALLVEGLLSSSFFLFQFDNEHGKYDHGDFDDRGKYSSRWEDAPQRHGGYGYDGDDFGGWADHESSDEDGWRRYLQTADESDPSLPFLKALHQVFAPLATSETSTTGGRVLQDASTIAASPLTAALNAAGVDVVVSALTGPAVVIPAVTVATSGGTTTTSTTGSGSGASSSSSSGGTSTDSASANVGYIIVGAIGGCCVAAVAVAAFVLVKRRNAKKAAATAQSQGEPVVTSTASASRVPPVVMKDKPANAPSSSSNYNAKDSARMSRNDDDEQQEVAGNNNKNKKKTNVKASTNDQQQQQKKGAQENDLVSPSQARKRKANKNKGGNNINTAVPRDEEGGLFTPTASATGVNVMASPVASMVPVPSKSVMTAPPVAAAKSKSSHKGQPAQPAQARPYSRGDEEDVDDEAQDETESYNRGRHTDSRNNNSRHTAASRSRSMQHSHRSVSRSVPRRAFEEDADESTVVGKGAGAMPAPPRRK